MDDSDEILIKIGVTGDQASKNAIRSVRGEMEKTDVATSKMSENMIKSGQKMALGVTLPMALIGYKAFGLASDLNEAKSATGTIFKEQAADILSWSNQSARAFGMSREEALSAVNGLGALFKGVGLSIPVAKDFSQGMVQAAADLGSFYNVDPGQVMEDLKSGLVGQAEPLRKYGILLSESAVKLKAQEMGLVAVNGEFTEAQKVQARQALIMASLGDANGDYARTADGAANGMRTMRASLMNLGAMAGGVLLPIAIKLIQNITRLAEGLQRASRPVKVIAAALFGVAVAAGPAMIAVGHLTKGFKLMGIGIQIGLGPLMLLVGAIALLGFAYKTNLLGFGDGVRWVGRQILDFLMPGIQVFQKLAGYITQVWQTGKIATGAFDGLSGSMRGIFRAIGVIVDGFHDLKNALFPKELREFNGMFGQVGTGPLKGIERLKYALERLPEALGRIAHGFGLLGARLFDAFTDLPWGQWLSDITAGLGAAFDAIPWGDLWELAKSAFRGIVSAGIDIADFAVNVALAAGGDLLNWAGNLIGWIKTKLFGGTSGAGVGDGTGGPAPVAGIDFRAALNVLLDKGGDLLEIGADLGAWVWNKFLKTGNFILPVAAFKLSAKIGLVNPDFTEAAKSAWDGLTTAISNATDIAGNIAGAIAEKIGGISGWVDYITVDSFNIGNAVGLALRGAIGGAVDVVTGLVGGVIDAIGKMEITGADVIHVATVVAEAIGVALLSLPALALSAVTAITSFLTGLLAGLLGKDIDGAGAASAVSGAIVNAISLLQGISIKTAIAALGKKAMDAVTSGLMDAATVAGAIKDAVVNAIGAAVDFASGIASSIASALSDMSGADFSGAGSAIAGALWDAIKGITDGWSVSDFIPFADRLGMGDKGGAKGIRKSSTDRGGGSGALGALGAQAGITTSNKTVLSVDSKQAIAALLAFRSELRMTASAVADMTSQMTARFANFAMTVATNGGRAGDQFRARFIAGMNSARGSSSAILGAIGANLSAFAGTAGGAGTSAGGSFSRNLRSSLSVASGIAASTLESIRANLSGDLSGSGYYLGASFGQGMLASLNDYMGAVYRAAAALGQSIMDGANSVIKRGSPSKAAYELTLSVPAGMITALHAGIPDVMSASARLGTAALPSWGGGSGVGVRAGGGGAGATVVHQTNTYHVDLKTMKELVEFSEFVGALPTARQQVRGR